MLSLLFSYIYFWQCLTSCEIEFLYIVFCPQPEGLSLKPLARLSANSLCLYLPKNIFLPFILKQFYRPGS